MEDAVELYRAEVRGSLQRIESNQAEQLRRIDSIETRQSIGSQMLERTLPDIEQRLRVLEANSQKHFDRDRRLEEIESMLAEAKGERVALKSDVLWLKWIVMGSVAGLGTGMVVIGTKLLGG